MIGVTIKVPTTSYLAVASQCFKYIFSHLLYSILHFKFFFLSYLSLSFRVCFNWIFFFCFLLLHFFFCFFYFHSFLFSFLHFFYIFLHQYFQFLFFSFTLPSLLLYVHFLFPFFFWHSSFLFSYCLSVLLPLILFLEHFSLFSIRFPLCFLFNYSPIHAIILNFISIHPSPLSYFVIYCYLPFLFCQFSFRHFFLSFLI